MLKYLGIWVVIKLIVLEIYKSFKNCSEEIMMVKIRK